MPRLSRLALAFLPLVLAACSEALRSPTGPAPFAPGDALSLAVSAYAGQIVINELMADPSAVSDADGEWLELHNRTDAPIDVGG